MGLFKQLKIGNNIGYTYSGKLKPLSFKYVCFALFFVWSVNFCSDIVLNFVIPIFLRNFTVALYEKFNIVDNS